jgi:hypothetical protein
MIVPAILPKDALYGFILVQRVTETEPLSANREVALRPLYTVEGRQPATFAAEITPDADSLLKNKSMANAGHSRANITEEGHAPYSRCR